MHQYDLSTYILSIVALAIAVERFTEAIKDSSLMAPVRVIIFRLYAFLSLRTGEEAVSKIRIACRNERGIRMYALLFIIGGLLAGIIKLAILIVRIPLLAIFWLLNSLLKCGLCLSGQLSTWAALMVPGGLYELTALDNWLVKAGLIWGLSNYIHTVYEVHRRGRVQGLDVTILDGEKEDEFPAEVEIDETDLPSMGQ